MAKSRTQPPAFTSDEEEGAYWEEHSTAPYWDEMEPVEVRVEAPRPRTKMISMRLSEEYLQELKRVAEQKGIPYQTLMRLWLVERLREEGAL